jgi:hypothetical protein
MNRYFNIRLVVLILFASCQGQGAQHGTAEKVTSANPATSLSNLFLDSLKLESFIKEQNVGDSTGRQLRNFYKSSNYQFAWFTEAGVTQSMRSFLTLHNTYIHNFGDTRLQFEVLHRDIRGLLNPDSAIMVSPKKRLQTELQLTSHFFVYLNNAYAGKANPTVMHWHIPRKKLDAVALLNSFLVLNGKDIEDWEPVNMFYKRLKKELLRYGVIEQNGGWKSIAIDGL